MYIDSTTAMLRTYYIITFLCIKTKFKQIVLLINLNKLPTKLSSEITFGVFSTLLKH